MLPYRFRSSAHAGVKEKRQANRSPRAGILEKNRRAGRVSLGIRQRQALPDHGASDMTTSQPSSVLRPLRWAALLRDGGGMTDGQLLECFITHRAEAAFAALVRRPGPVGLGVCRRVLHNRDDTEDAFQVTFLVLVRKAASIRQRELVGNWLYGTAGSGDSWSRANARAPLETGSVVQPRSGDTRASST